MPLTQIDICNQALARSKAPEITAITEDNEGAILCNRFYDSALEEVMSLFHWNSATKRISLVANTTPPAFGWLHAYDLPADYVTAIDLDNAANFVIEGVQLLTNSAACNLTYIAAVDVSQLKPLTASCVVLMLASKIVASLTGDPQAGNEFLNELYQSTLLTARVADRFENNNAEPADDWTNFDAPPVSQTTNTVSVTGYGNLN